MKNDLNLYDLWELIKRNIIKLLTFMFIGLGVAGVITFFILTPQYSSQTQLIALPNENAEVGNGVNNNLMMINTYKDLVKSNLVIDTAVDELNSDYHYSETNASLNKAVSVSQEQNSQMFTIKAVADNPVKAKNIANVVANVFQKKALKVMKVDKISVTSKAAVNPQPVSPNNILNLIIGMGAGLLLGLIFIFFNAFRDKTIKDEDWIVDNLGITVLGSIPEMTSTELSVRIKQVDSSQTEEKTVDEFQEVNPAPEQSQRRSRRRI